MAWSEKVHETEGGSKGDTGDEGEGPANHRTQRRPKHSEGGGGTEGVLARVEELLRLGGNPRCLPSTG